MRKFVLLMLVVAAGVAVPSARADPPGRFPIVAFDGVDTTCGFPVAIHIVSQGETLTVFNDRSIITGLLSIQVSANGKTDSLAVSGPGFFIFNPDGSVTIVGRGVGFGPTQTANGVTLAYNAGVVSVDPATGIATIEHGTILLDVCAALAP
jgi:hypothetical protein